MTIFTSTSNLTGKTVIVTGANSGIGRATAQALAGYGARVVFAVRDIAKGERAAADVPGITEVRQLDLASPWCLMSMCSPRIGKSPSTC